MTTQNNKIRTRLAPSPTGYVHIGNFRTALFAYLSAKHSQGDFILRIEDTDRSRLVDDSMVHLLQVFKKFGIEFDEGPRLDEKNEIIQVGDKGPYIQSQRLDIYSKYANQLLENKHAYYCFCSSERLDEVRKEQIALKKPPMYDRHCRNISPEQIEDLQKEFATQGKKPVIRMAVPEAGSTIVHDLVYGQISYENSLLDDQVLIKSDGFPTYHLAVVIDDHLMEISHVHRGEEWLSSAPKHVLLYKFFGWEPPIFVHLPLILNPDRSKLSKRQGDVSAEDFLQAGFLPEALINFVALLGWNPKSEQEIFSLQELIENFSEQGLNKAGAVFDREKLLWMNSQYLKNLSIEDFASKLKSFLQSQNVSDNLLTQKYLLKVSQIEQSRLRLWSEILDHKFYFQDPEYDANLLVWKKSNSQDAKQKLQSVNVWLKEMMKLNSDNGIQEIEEFIKNKINESGFDNGSVLWPLRVSLSGLQKSPSPFELIFALNNHFNPREVFDRIEKAISSL